MPTTYRLQLDAKGSGPRVRIDELDAVVPSPAVVKVRKTGDLYEYELVLELVAGAWPVTTALQVKGTGGHTVSAVTLRDMRLGQMQRACAMYLRRGSRKGLWPVETITLFHSGDTREGLKDHFPLIEALQPDARIAWDAYLPATRWVEDSEGNAVEKAPAEWLQSVKSRGARSDVALRATAALYKKAVAEGMTSPNAYVEQMLELPKSTASEWIRKARERGLLEQSTRRPRSDRRPDDA